MSFEQMLDESFKTIHNGEVVEGTVIDVKDDEIILNIGYKADGIITKSEYTNDNTTVRVRSFSPTNVWQLRKVTNAWKKLLRIMKFLLLR